MLESIRIRSVHLKSVDPVLCEIGMFNYDTLFKRVFIIYLLLVNFLLYFCSFISATDIPPNFLT